MKLLTNYLYIINDSDVCYRFFYKNGKQETKVAVWELIDLERNEWKLTKEKYIHPSIKKEMENILYHLTEGIKKVEKGENGFGSLSEINEITHKKDSISCKVQLKGIVDDIIVTFFFEKKEWVSSDIHTTNETIRYVFYTNEQWSQNFVQELYNDKKLRLFFVTN